MPFKSAVQTGGINEVAVVKQGSRKEVKIIYVVEFVVQLTSREAVKLASTANVGVVVVPPHDAINMHQVILL